VHRSPRGARGVARARRPLLRRGAGHERGPGGAAQPPRAARDPARALPRNRRRFPPGDRMTRQREAMPPVRLVILDRDGVINHDSDDFIRTPAEWVPIDGSLEGIALLTRSGYTVAVATNQSGIGRGLYDHAALAAIHDKMR